MTSLTIESRRGAQVESVHRVSVAVADADGGLLAHSGNPELVTYLRSAAKPFQAMPLVHDGVVERFGLSGKDLALCCASHNSEPRHIEGARGLLERIGCTEADLACGPHRPLWRDLALSSRVTDLAEAPRTPIASNCSGKHAGMLALARHRGWPAAGYQKASHPVQHRCRDEVARWAGLSPDALGVAVDGCGVSCFAMPLVRMALAFARLGVSEEAPARAVVAAMTGHPDMVAGRGRLCTDVMNAYPGRVLAKIGAEGVYGAALPEEGLGIALKVEDGDSWGSMIALVTVLDALKLKPSAAATLPEFAGLPIRNTRGEVTGDIRAAGALTFD